MSGRKPLSSPWNDVLIGEMCIDDSGIKENILIIIKNCNNKGLGIYYLLLAFIFGIYGTLISIYV